MKKCQTNFEKNKYDDKIKALDEEISSTSCDSNAKKVEEQVKKLSDSDGRLSTLCMWKIKKLVSPRGIEPPMAKLDEEGNLITSPHSLKELYLSTYEDRLKNRQIAEGLEDIKELKEELWSKGLELVEKQKTPNWTMEQLNKVLKSLKPNKAS